MYVFIYLFKLPFPIFPTFSHTLFHKIGKLPHSPATKRPVLTYLTQNDKGFIT